MSKQKKIKKLKKRLKSVTAIQEKYISLMFVTLSSMDIMDKEMVDHFFDTIENVTHRTDELCLLDEIRWYSHARERVPNFTVIEGGKK